MLARLSFCLILLTAAFYAGGANQSAGQNPQPRPSIEDAYRANNIGVALLEQYKHKEAAEEFRRALKLEPSLALARLNLGIALYNVPDLDGANRELKLGAASLPDSPHLHYLLGLIARTQNRNAEALAEFQRVVELDPHDPGANINLGQLLMQQRKYPEAIAALRAALSDEPYNATATYNLGMVLIRSGQRDEGQRLLQKFQELRAKGYGTTLGQNYPEQGRYAEAIASTGSEPGVVDTATPDVRFVDATSGVLPPQESASIDAKLIAQNPKLNSLSEAQRNQLLAMSGGAVPVDVDGDDDLDLLSVSPKGLRLYRNDGARFVDVTDQSGLSRAVAETMPVRAVAGDYDNDGRTDILLLNIDRLNLFHNGGNGKFVDVTTSAGIPKYAYLSVSAAMVDVDHDGDLDIFVAGCADLNRSASGENSATRIFPDEFPGAANLLLRNNGDGRFTDITTAAGISGSGGHAISVVPTDFDNRRDIDLLLVNSGNAPVLFSNQRDGTFRDVASEVGLNTKGRFTCVAAGDVNKDDFVDFFLARADGPDLIAMSNGKGRFVATPAPFKSQGIAVQFLDYDNDGLLDLLSIGEQQLKVFRNLGAKWEDVTARALADLPSAPARGFGAGDVDSDGDTDAVIALANGSLRLLRNEGGSRNSSLKVQITGKVSNRKGTGSKIEIRAGSLKQKLETYAAAPSPAPADVIFGIGKRPTADTMRILWPSGILQAETESPDVKLSGPRATLNLTEIDRKPSSCPYLYTWNGDRFEFVTDFMGGGEMGYWEAPGMRNHPDPTEYVRIRDDQLKPRENRFEIRVTNELEEVVYTDHLRLIAIAHPADTEVYPNEGMTEPPRPFKLFATRYARPPRSVFDDHGHDVKTRIEKLDRTYPDDFKLSKIRGYAEMHDLILDLGETSKAQTLLLLTGWTDYAFSSDNVAASQSGMKMKPPELQARTASGGWSTIADIGIPVGRPQTIVLDLTGKLPDGSHEVKIVTNMRIYWDQILVDTSASNDPSKTEQLALMSADLRWRGFSAEVSPDGREPTSFDYNRVLLHSPWKVMSGRYTREGDVGELLARSDDMFVISRPGDEIALSFDATRLKPLPKGWKRTFLLYADGFSKEMDINSASPDQVTPLPFHAMKHYPYAAGESYPMTRAHQAYIKRYNTRVVRRQLQSIDALRSAPAPESSSQKAAQRD